MMTDNLGGALPVLDWESQDLPRAWKTFQTHVEFMFKGPLKSKSEEEKCNYLMIWVGNKGREVYSTWNLSADDQKDLKKLYDNFAEYVEPKANRVFARYKFQCIVQSETDTCEQFITALRVQVKECGYTNPDEMVRDRIVFGIRAEKVREKLIMQGSDLTLDKAIEIARTFEMSQAQLKTMAAEDPKLSVDLVTRQKRGKVGTANSYRSKNFRSKPVVNICSRCGLPEHGANEKCPAIGQLCHKCNKQDHFSRMCKTKPPKVHVKTRKSGDHKPKSQSVNYVEEELSDSLFFGMLTLDVNSVDSANEEWSTTLDVSSVPVKFHLDTGAKCNVLNKHTFRKLQVSTPVDKLDYKLKSYSNHIIPAEGIVHLPVKHDNIDHMLKFYIVDLEAPNVLGAETCKNLDLVRCVPVNRVVTPNSLTDAPVGDSILEQPEYFTLFEGLGCLPGTYSIKLDSSVPPTIHPPRKVPAALMDRVRAELSRMEEIGVIARQTEPTEWVNSMVVVNKGDKIRICIDPKDLNRAIMREHFPLKTIDDVLANMPNAKYFSKLDAVSGFWQIQLDDRGSKLCTFNTPFGRYRFTRMPFGIKSAPEVFQNIMSQMVEDIEGAESIIDDILVWGATVEEHDMRVKRVLQKAKQYNLKLSRSKCEIRRSELKYVGHLLTQDGVKPDPEKVRAVKSMNKPENKQELLTFLGFVQYLGKFMPRMSDVSAPLRKLTEKSVVWNWSKEHDVSFNALKAMASDAPVLRYFDPKLPLTLSVDASSKGIGAVILQEGQPIAYGSRALTTAQQNYAQIEKEALAVVYGCTKFHYYIYGRPVLVESDHKPLQSIFAKPLMKAPLRLQRLLLTLQKYDLKVTYKPGKLMFLADALSRSYLDETKEDLVPEVDVNVVSLNSHLPLSADRYSELQEHTANDTVLQALHKVVRSGWPESKTDLPDGLSVYWSFRDEITTVDGLLFKGSKLIVPKASQKRMLEDIHDSHLGIVKCKSRARDVIFWPGMSSQIEEMVSKCAICAELQNSNPKEPMTCAELPSRPWSRVASDIFTLHQSNYLLTVDYYSKWPEIMKMTELSSRYVISAFKSQFSKYGIPDELVTDNGPQYASKEFKDFAKEYGFVHTTSSPLYPQSNGQAERTVQTVKRLLKKSRDPYQSLMDYRNTQIEGIGLSPAQMFLGRRIKTKLPTSAELLRSADDVQSKLKDIQLRTKQYYDSKAGSVLPKLHVGDTVMLKDDIKRVWKHGSVEAEHSTPKSYIVNIDGKRYRRNRSMLRPTKSCAPLKTKSEPIVLDDSTDTFAKPQSAVTANPPCSPSTPSPCKPGLTSPAPLVKQTRSGRLIKLPSKFSDYQC